MKLIIISKIIINSLDQLGPLFSVTAYVYIAFWIGYFLVPYFVLGDIRRAIIFLATVLIVYGVEVLADLYLPKLLFLPTGGITAAVLVLLVVISNAVVVESFDEVSNIELETATNKDWVVVRTRSCPECQADLDDESKTCRACGAVINSAILLSSN